MGFAAALSVLSSIAAAASVAPELGLRGEGRTSTLAASGIASETRGALFAAPRAGLLLDAASLRLAASYEPRIWTSDVVERPSPVVTHRADLGVATRHDRPWTAALSARAERGRTDPLADPREALARLELADAAALVPVPYEELRAGAGGSVSFDLRTTLSGGGRAWYSGGIDAADRRSLPVQRGAAAELSLARLASRRDTARLRAAGSATTTAARAGDVDAASASAAIGWRRRLGSRLDGWVDAGTAVWWEDRGDVPVRRGALPVGEAGIAYARSLAAVELAAGVAPYVDRLTGVLDPMVRGRAALRWRRSPRVTGSVAAHGGALPGGDTVLGFLDARWRWAPRERLALEAGVVGRWQRERRAGLPSFAEGGVVLAFEWERAPRAPPSPAPGRPPDPAPAPADASGGAAPAP